MDKNVRYINEIHKLMLKNSYPYGDKWERRKVMRVYNKQKAWYKVGDVLKVKYFATFGCYDINDRWIDYYDLGLPLMPWYKKCFYWFVNLFK